MVQAVNVVCWQQERDQRVPRACHGGGTDLLAAPAGLCLSSHVSCQENAATRSQHSRAGPGERRYQAAGASSGASSSSRDRCHRCASPFTWLCAPAEGPRARLQRQALPADVGPGQGSATGRERPGAQSWQAEPAKGFSMPVLNHGGFGRMGAAPPSPGLGSHCPPAAPCPCRGGGGSAPAHELAPETVLGSSWQCQWITLNSISTALIYVP